MTVVVDDRFSDAVGQPMASIPTPPAPQTQWTIVAGANNVGPQYVIANARSRQLSFKVDDSATFNFSLDGNDAALSYITELVTDIWVYRNGALLFRGRVGSSTDTIDGEADTYDVAFNVFDYREWLGRQMLQPSHVWSWKTKTQAQILQDLITFCINGQSGIHPAITLDVSKMPASTVNFDTTPGTSVKEVIGTMAGFGWQVIPTSTLGLTLRAIPSFYYALNNKYVLQFGSTIRKLTRSFDTGGYANSTVYTGDMALAPVQSDATGIATMPQGRIGETVSDPSIVDSTHLTHAAQVEAARAQAVVPSWACELTPGAWKDATDAWIGDICRFIVQKGRINVNDQYRITDINIAINDDNAAQPGDTVTATVVKPPLS
jgi:hypothetical protein